MWELQGALAEIAGLPHVSLQPSAGAHGELAGVLLTRAYHEDRGEQRTKVLTPDTAHGTNPATVTMGGYEVVKVGTNARRRRRHRGPAGQGDRRGRLPDAHQPEHARAVRPATSSEIATIVHDVGATLYYDGANLNAVMGTQPPRRHGLRHRALQPAQDVHPAARRRRPRRRPDRGVATASSRTCPIPQVVRTEDGNGAGPAFDLDFDRPKSIGRLRGFQGNYGVFVRSYAYIRQPRRRRPAGGVARPRC